MGLTITYTTHYYEHLHGSVSKSITHAAFIHIQDDLHDLFKDVNVVKGFNTIVSDRTHTQTQAVIAHLEPKRDSWEGIWQSSAERSEVLSQSLQWNCVLHVCVCILPLTVGTAPQNWVGVWWCMCLCV